MTYKKERRWRLISHGLVLACLVFNFVMRKDKLSRTVVVGFTAGMVVWWIFMDRRKAREHHRAVLLDDLLSEKK